MIDPDSIIVQQKNENNTIKFGNVPEFDFITYDLEDDKEFKKYLSTIEKEVRGSYEYKAMIKYLKEYMGMDQCAFISKMSSDETDIKIEIHHYPFTLYDIVNIVYRKRIHYGESLEVQMVSKEIMMLHYKLLIGLIPLSVTAHQLTHDSKLFIPVQNVLGRYNLFLDFYKPFCEEDQLETLNRIEKYSYEQLSDLYNSSSILDQNTININYTDSKYQLPDINNINSVMNSRIEDIKKNNYKLPTIEDIKENNRIEKTIKPALYFSKKE